MARILLCYQRHSAPRGGSGVHGHHLVRVLRALGHELLTAERQSDERLRRFPRNLRGLRAMLAEADCIYARVAARRFDRALLEWNRRTRRLPLVVELNAPPEETLAYGSGLLRAARLQARRLSYHRTVGMADALVCVSRTLAEHARRTFPALPDRVEVVPNGGAPAAAPAAGSTQGFHVVWAGGSRRPWQALDLVVEVARRLVARVPDARVHVFDSDARPLPATPGLVMHGARSHAEVLRALAGMDAALCPYREPAGPAAGFYFSPLKLFEAMAAGLPVVATRLGQIAEVVEHGRSGWLVGDDADEVAGRLGDLARDRTRCKAMGATALERIRSAWTWEHTGARVDAVLRAALAERAGTVALADRIPA